LGFDSKTNSKSQYITFGPPQPIDPNHDVYNFYTAPPVGLYNGYNQEVNIGYSPKYKVVSVCLSFARTDTGTAKRIIDIIYNNVKKGFYGECKTSRVKGITDQTIIKSKNVEIIIDRIDGSKPQTDLERVYGTVTISFCCNFAKLKKAYDETDPLVIH
jgi:hypothetical protein